MSRPHENDEDDVSFSMKTQTYEVERFENATDSASCGRVEFTENEKLLKTIGHVISVPVH